MVNATDLLRLVPMTSFSFRVGGGRTRVVGEHI